MNEEKEETKRKECLDQRNSYIKDLSTGSFGLSFIFGDKIVQDTIQRPGIFVYSWVMFACSDSRKLILFNI